jgi:hypothetical protein
VCVPIKHLALSQRLPLTTATPQVSLSTRHRALNILKVSVDLIMDQRSSDVDAQQQGLLKLPLELHLDIYKLVLFSKNEEDNDNDHNAPFTFTVVKHKAHCESCRGKRRNVFKLSHVVRDCLALSTTCTQLAEEMQLHINENFTWYFESTDVLSCFLGTSLQFYLPDAITKSRTQLLAKSGRVVVVIPEWDLWGDAPAELTRLGEKLAVPLPMKFVDQIDKGVESRGLVAAEDCWKLYT